MQIRTKMWIALTVVFVSGLVIGFCGGQAYVGWRILVMLRRGPAWLQESIVLQIAHRLHPQKDQMAAIEEAIQRATQDLGRLRREHIAAFSARMEQALVEMRPSLTAEQQRALDRLDVNELLPPPVRDFQKQPAGEPSAGGDGCLHGSWCFPVTDRLRGTIDRSES